MRFLLSIPLATLGLVGSVYAQQPMTASSLPEAVLDWYTGGTAVDRSRIQQVNATTITYDNVTLTGSRRIVTIEAPDCASIRIVSREPPEIRFGIGSEITYNFTAFLQSARLENGAIVLAPDRPDYMRITTLLSNGEREPEEGAPQAGTYMVGHTADVLRLQYRFADRYCRGR